jgi:uncharacterized protein (TIGR02118 family)
MTVRLSVLYPATEGAKFDHDYYATRHVPLCLSAWDLDEAQIDKGIDGPYVAAVHFEFESMDELERRMGSPDTAKVVADVANYTTITPVRQLSEVVS